MNTTTNEVMNSNKKEVISFNVYYEALKTTFLAIPALLAFIVSMLVAAMNYFNATIQFLSRQFRALVTKTLQAIFAIYIVNIALMVSIMVAQHYPDSPLAWAYLESLRVISKAVLEEVSILLRLIIYYS